MQNNGIPDGSFRPQVVSGEYNKDAFVIAQMISQMATSMPVQVVSCTNDGGLSPVGMVTVVPMVNQIDGAGNGVPHTRIFNVPYMRIQGGTDAVIIDPKPGDIGNAFFASRDITKVKATKAQANPGSARQYSWGDAIYLGGLLNATPQQYVRFSSDGIEISSPTKIVLKAPAIEIDGPVTMTQDLQVADDILSGTVSVQHHRHISAASGSPTGEPIV